MKNLFLSMLAVAGMLMATSCSKEDAVSESSDFVNATFTIGAENGIGTRADIGKGLSANTVACAVFDANGEEMPALRQYVPVSGKQATYRVRLAKGQDYRVAFFAYNADSNGNSSYYDVTDMKSIKILPNQASNIEARDAFTNFINIAAADLTNKSNIEKTVYLKRPFAQLNLGIDQTEYDDAKNAGVVITNSAITVSSVWNAFNAYDDDIADDATSAPMVFAMNVIPNESLTIGTDEYTYLALNYLLVGDKGQEKSLTDVEFKWETANGKTNEPTTHFLNIPVQRNYRTNIIGKLLTTPAEFTIKIDSNFETTDGYVEEVETVISKSVKNAAELQDAINNAPIGQTRIVLSQPITGGQNFVVNQKKDVQILIDGQDKMLVGNFTVNGGSQWGGTEGLSLQNIQFTTSATGEYNIVTVGENSGSSRYAHNVTITDCNFVWMNSYDENCKVVGIRAYQANDLTVNNCDFSKLHSVAQITGGNNVKFQQVSSDNCVRGISLGSATNALITNCNINATGDKKYGIRHNADYETAGLKIVESTINAYFPVVVRCTNGAAKNYTLAFEGNNTLVKGADSDYHVAIAMSEYDTVGETLTALSGTVVVNGADSSWVIFK